MEVNFASVFNTTIIGASQTHRPVASIDPFLKSVIMIPDDDMFQRISVGILCVNLISEV